MDNEKFEKGEEVLYLDKATGKQLRGVVKGIDYACDPPSYAVHIPSLDTTRETVASRLTHINQVASPPAPAASAPASTAGASPTLDPKVEAQAEQAAQPPSSATGTHKKKRHKHHKIDHAAGQEECKPSQQQQRHHNQQQQQQQQPPQPEVRASPGNRGLRHSAPAWPWSGW